MGRPIFLCDIDGTVADLSHRLHFIENDPKDWPSFFAACGSDSPIHDVISLVKHISKACDLIMVTGRSDEVEEITMQWLRDNGIPYLTMYMRKAGDHRPDNIVKAELLEDIRSDWGYYGEIIGAFEDRQQVVDMYRSKGLRVYQVAAGNF